MKIAIIDKKDCAFKVDNSTIKIEDTKIPLKLIDTLLIYSTSSISSKDIIKINSQGVNILFVNSYSHKSSIAISTEPKNAQIKLQQFSSLSKKVHIAKHIIAQKIKNHTYQLTCNDIFIDSKEYLQKLSNADSIETILGVEGSFAREYFKHYFTLIPKKFHKGKRSKHPPLDPANSLLSYFYYTLYHITTIKLISFGFDPSIGYLHTPFRSHQALSSDMMEYFRDRINQFVIFLFSENIIDINDFYKKGGVYLKYEAKKKLHKYLKELWDGLDNKIDARITELKGML